ncbi:MAG: restriction endonuclease [Actinomycetota bacterium]|nr:restriction endonuclease [Actinomycetota bacterium]
MRKRNKSNLIGDLIEGSYKNPVWGLIISAVLGIAGFIFSHESLPAHPNLSASIRINMFHTFVPILYVLALVALFFSAAGYILSRVKKGMNKSPDAVPTAQKKAPAKNEDEYLRQENNQKKKETANGQAGKVDNIEPVTKSSQTASPDNSIAVSEEKRIELSEDTLKKMEWYSFEMFCKLYFETAGWKVVKTGAGADGGVDLLLFENTSTWPYALVQCKARSHKGIGVNYARELLGVMSAESVKKGILITNSFFSEDAIEFGGVNQIELIDLSIFWRLIEKLNESSKSALVNFLKTTDFITPTCPNCEIKMIERTAKKGKSTGQKFWGCRNYPRCLYILKMNYDGN